MRPERLLTKLQRSLSTTYLSYTARMLTATVDTRS